MGQLLWIRDDANRANPLRFRFDAYYEIGTMVIANDNRRLAIDFLEFNTIAPWQEATGCANAKAGNCETPGNRTRGRAFDFTAPVGPECHILAQHIH